MIKVSELYIKRIKGQPPEKAESLTLIEGLGVEGDVFACGGERQVSILLLSTRDEISAVPSKEMCLKKFSCNIALDGCGLSQMYVGKRLDFGGAELELTCVGRPCHDLCELGSCPLTQGAIFASVTRGGVIRIGDEA